MIIDAHMHIWDQVDGQAGGETPVKAVGQGQLQIGDQLLQGMPAYMHDCAARAEHFVAEMDAAGVDQGIVVQEFVDGPQNEYCRAAMRDYPDRLHCLALPNWWQPDQVGAEADAWLSQGFSGLKIPAIHMQGKARLDDARLMPVYRRLEREDHVLGVDLSEGEAQVSQMEHILGQAPSLRVALGHFGFPNRGGWPGQLKLCHHPHVYLDTGGIVWLYRHEGPPFPTAQAKIREAIDEVGVEKLMWGSDWPRTMLDFTYRQSLDFLRDSDRFSDEEKQWLLGKSAATLYQLHWHEKNRPRLPLITEG